MDWNRIRDRFDDATGGGAVDDDFVHRCYQRIEQACQTAPTQYMKRLEAEKHLVSITKAAIVQVFHEERPDAVMPALASSGFPFVRIQLRPNRVASIQFAVSHEAHALSGGDDVEHIDVQTPKPPQNAAQRLIGGLLAKRNAPKPPAGSAQPKPSPPQVKRALQSSKQTAQKQTIPASPQATKTMPKQTRAKRPLK